MYVHRKAVHHEHLLQASIEDAYLHLPSSEIPAERGSVETTIVFLDLESDDGKLVKQIGNGASCAKPLRTTPYELLSLFRKTP